MAINITLPQVGVAKKTAKDHIITLLSQKWPLSTKEIYNSIAKEHGFVGTYQAVHKTLNLLLAEKILIQENKKYKLNSNWIETLHDFEHSLRQTYIEGSQKYVAGKTNYVLDSFYDVDKFLISIVSQNLPEKGEKEVMVMHWNHFWLPLFLSMKEYSQIKDTFKDFRIYALGQGKTPIDKWCKNFWEKTGNHIKIGQNVAQSCDLLVFKDFVIEVYHPPEFKKELGKFFSKSKKIEDLDMHQLFGKIFQKQAKIPAVVNRNQEIADQIIKQTIKQFKGKKNAA